METRKQMEVRYQKVSKYSKGVKSKNKTASTLGAGLFKLRPIGKSDYELIWNKIE